MNQADLNEKNQLLIDQFKRKKVNYEKKFVELLEQLANFYTKNYEEYDEISDETISNLFMNNVNKDDNKDASIALMNKILEAQHGIVKIDYIIKRNKFDEDGNFDPSLDISEITSTKETAKMNCIKMGIEKIRQSSYTITSMYRSLTEQNADFRIRYEIQKEFMCNKYGYTPESFDEYFKAIKEHNSKVYDEKGNNVRKGAFVHPNSVNKQFEHLLKKLENWNGEDVVYKSEFLTKYKEEYAKMEKERPRGTEGAKMYSEFLRMNKSIVLNNMPGYKGNNKEGETRMGEEVKVSNRKSLREERLKRRKHNNTPAIEMEKEETRKVESKEVDYAELIPNEHSEVKESIENKEVEKSVEEVVTSIEPKDEPIETIENDYDFEEVFVKEEQKADVSILRSNKPNKLKLYNESYKYGRLLYLPYSGYEVLVKRIVDRSQLSYILELLQSMKMATDLTVELEIIRIIYNNLEFFFDETPSEIDFYKNLSIRDIPLLITTMALISQKEDKDGRVLVEVDRIICGNDNCSKRIVLEKPITINLKNKFKEIYPIDLYYSHHHLYKEKNYTNIYSAYADSIDGSLVSLTSKDDTLSYTCIYGKSTFYNTSESMTKKINELIYQLFKDDLDMMSESDLEKEFPMLDMKGFVENKLLIQLQLRYDEILRDYPDIEQEVKIEDKSRTDDELDLIDEYKHLRALFIKLDKNLNEMENMISVITNIRTLKIKLIDSGELVINANTNDLYELFNTVISLPKEFYTMILDKFVDYQKEMSEFDYKRTFIKVTSNIIKGNVKVNSVLKPREEFIKYIDSKYSDEEIKKQWTETYDLSLKNLEDGMCTCGHDEFYINHFNLLFFSIISLTGVKINLD